MSGTIPTAANGNGWLPKAAAFWRRANAGHGASDKYVTAALFLIPAFGPVYALCHAADDRGGVL